MNTQKGQVEKYTIKEAAKLSGLAESNLRYYESIGLIPYIERDKSSKHRIYSEDNINYIVSIACLSATGMSITDMQEYLRNVDRGVVAAGEQIKLLSTQSLRLLDEERSLKLRQKYLGLKVDYWKAVSDKKIDLANKIAKKAVAVAKEVKEFRISN